MQHPGAGLVGVPFMHLSLDSVAEAAVAAATACCSRWFACAMVAFTICTSVRTDVVM